MDSFGGSINKSDNSCDSCRKSVSRFNVQKPNNELVDLDHF